MRSLFNEAGGRWPPALAVCAALIAIGCSDDGPAPGADEGGGNGGRSGGGGRAAGAGGSGVPPQSPPSEGPLNCDPLADPREDRCLACLTRRCCREVHACGTSGVNDSVVRDYSCYDTFFGCAQACFEREIERAASTSSEEVLLDCGAGCSNPFEHGEELLACASGSLDAARDADAGSETLAADDDAGTSQPSCAAECFDGWR